MTTRRHFLRLSAMTTLSTGIIPNLVKAANQHEIRPRKNSIAKGQTILFQGDSITDAGRDRGRATNKRLVAPAGPQLFRELGFLEFGLPGSQLAALLEREGWDTLSLAYIPLGQALVFLIAGRWLMRRGDL